MTGRPVTVRGADMERALRRVRSFHARGMTYAQMESQVGLNSHVIGYLARRSPRFVRRDTWDLLVRIRFEPPVPNAWVDPVGTRRRLGALWREGYPLPWISDRLQYGNRSYLQGLLKGAKGTAGVEYSSAQAVADLYDKLEGSSPAEFGIERRSSRFASTFAAKRGCAPRRCWDPDTIDDPQAHPQWTGQCGSPLGWIVHERDGIPMCDPCRESASVFVLDADALRRLRVSSGYSRQQLADLSQIKEETYRRWESGRNTPRYLDELDRVLSVLDVTFEEVYQWPDDSASPPTAPRFGKSLISRTS